MTYVQSETPAARTTAPPRSPGLTPGPVWQVSTGLLAIAVPIITAADISFSARPALALLYLLAVPGIPVAALIRLPSRLASVSLAIAISLAFQVLVAEGSLLASALNAVLGEVITSVVALAALGLASIRYQLFAGAYKSGRTRSSGVARGSPIEGGFTALGLVVALAMWILGVRRIEPTDMDQYGLISVVVRSTVPAALVVVAALAVVELRRPTLRSGWLAAITAAFVVILQGTPAAIESAAGLPSAWVHVGFSQYIRDHGAVLHGFDARFSWPGFFAMLANLTTSAGLPDAGEFLRWAPLVQDLLMLLPVMLLARSLCSAKWMVWVAGLLYTAGNWFQQDYLSPQGLALYLSVTVIALVIWSAGPHADAQDGGGGIRDLSRFLRRPHGVTTSISGMTRTAHLSLGAALVLLLLAVAVSHQLTPVALVLALSWIAFVRRTQFPGLWIIMALMTLAWVFYGATDYWSGHLNEMFGGVGSLGSSLTSGVGGRIVGSTTHTEMLYLRSAYSGVFILVALAGIFHVRRSGNGVLLLGLCFAPFLIVALQSYGGEVVIRAFVYAFPGLVIAAAEALGWMVRRGRQWAGASMVLFVALGLMLTATRGANAPFERITPTQLQAAAAFNAMAARGSTVGSFSSFNPLGRLEPGRYFGKFISPNCAGTGSAVRCTIATAPDYFFITSSQEAYGELSESRPPGWTNVVIGQLVADHQYTISYRVSDAVILKRVGPKA